MILSPLYEPIKTQSKITDKVLVSYSGGKESAVVLDLCARYFKHVVGFFMYYIEGLSFQEALLRWAEKKYGIEIIRVPHFELSELLRYGSFRQMDFDVSAVSVKETYNYVREQTGIYWIAGGERVKDSIIRRAMMLKSGSIDATRGRFFPVAYWNKQQTLQYIAKKNLKISPERAIMGASFSSLQARDLIPIKQHYPEDYALIRSWFPLCELCVKQEEFRRLRDGEEGSGTEQLDTI